MGMTTKEFADKAGVSIATVTAVLSGRESGHKVSDAIRKRVKRVADECGFCLSQGQRNLRLKRSAVIGVIVPELGNPFFAGLISALEHEATARQYQLMVCSSGDDAATEAEAVEMMMNRSIDGLILATTSYTPSDKIDIPVVYVDRPVSGDDQNVVVSDHYGGSVSAAEHLLGVGCKHIAFLGRLDGIPSSDERRRAFSHTVETAGLPYDPSLVYRGARDRASAKKGMAQILDDFGSCPDGVFTVSFDLLEGVLDCLIERYGELPKDIQLATFDDHPLVDYLPVPVFSVRQDSHAMAVVAMEKLLAEVQGLPIHERRHQLPIRLIDRSK